MILWELIKVFVVSSIGINGIILMGMVVAEATKFGFGPAQILAIIPLITPSILPYTIPGTTLFATCIVYGRLAADNEILAIKSAGVNLLVIVRPAVLLGLVMSGCTMALYFEVIPRTFHTMRTMALNDVREFLYSLLRKDKVIATRQAPFRSMAVKDVEGWKLIKPTFKEWDAHNNLTMFARAESADLEVDLAKHLLLIRMWDVEVASPSGDSQVVNKEMQEFDMELPSDDLGTGKQSPRAMTWREMLEHRRRWLHDKEVDKALIAEARRQPGAAEDPNLPIHIQNLENEAARCEREVLMLDVEMLMRPALSFGCLFFILVGCPVGIWFSRSDYLSAFITSFLPIVITYYPLLICGVGLAKVGRINPFLLVWGADGLIGAVGVVLFWRLLKN
jgi:lipopolysaccharide export system permease protein